MHALPSLAWHSLYVNTTIYMFLTLLNLPSRDVTGMFQLEEQRRVEEEYDEKLRLEREAKEREERELARQERHKQRELMKELRAKRASEREVLQAMNLLKEQQKQEVLI